MTEFITGNKPDLEFEDSPVFTEKGLGFDTLSQTYLWRPAVISRLRLADVTRI